MITSRLASVRRQTIATALFLVLAGCQTESEQVALPTADSGKFLVIAHRGASGYRPEHTIAAYKLAIEQGADFIEPDLVPTKDGALIARHENALAVVKLRDGEIDRDAQGNPIVISATTDVAERAEFAHLLRVAKIDGRPLGGWFSEDFTLAEIKTLHARERIPELRPDNTNFNDLRIPSLTEILELLGRPENAHVGIYPELKHPTHFRYGKRHAEGPAIAIDTAKLLVDALVANRFTDQERLFIQCFEVAPLRRLKHQLLPQAGFDAPLVQLVSVLARPIPDVEFHRREAGANKQAATSFQQIYGPLSQTFLDDPSYESLVSSVDLIAQDYAAGLGPRKSDARVFAPAAIAAGLELHPYTIRGEAHFLSPLRGAIASSVSGELEKLRGLGATGVFIDQPDLATQWLVQLKRQAPAQHTAQAPSEHRQDQ